jgi:hypothetical protein
VRHLIKQSGSAALLALASGLALFSVASAQDSGGGNNAQPVFGGLIEGVVMRCVNGAETPAVGVMIGVEGGSAQLAKTDDGGNFILSLPPGTYTITATASDGFASRPFVPVDQGETLDMGILDIGGGVAGCGPAEDVVAPVLPTFTPTAAATAVPPTATPTVAPPPPTATPVPAPAEGGAGSPGSPGSPGSGG